jgi:hypothetical protein
VCYFGELDLIAIGAPASLRNSARLSGEWNLIAIGGFNATSGCPSFTSSLEQSSSMVIAGDESIPFISAPTAISL